MTHRALIPCLVLWLAAPMAADAGDFSEVINRVKETGQNATSFFSNANNTATTELTQFSSDDTSGALQQANDFYNNEAPHEVLEGTKIGLSQLFPQAADALDATQNVLEGAQNIVTHASEWATQAQQSAQAVLDAVTQKVSNLGDQLSSYFSSGDASDGLENGGSDQAYVSQSGGGSGTSFNEFIGVSAALPAPPPAPASSLTDADLAAIGASNTGGPSAPTSLAADAQQLPGQLATFDQQQAAAEAARQAELQALQAQQAAQEQARQQRELQAAQTYMQSQNAAPAEPPSSGSGWGNVLSFGMGVVQQYLGARQGGVRSNSNFVPLCHNLQPDGKSFVWEPCNSSPTQAVPVSGKSCAQLGLPARCSTQ